MKLIVCATLALLLAACGSSHVLVGQARPAIDPEDVRIYTSPPADYEEVALLASTSRYQIAITEQQKMSAAINGLKKEAASLGANGILLTGVSDRVTHASVQQDAYGNVWAGNKTNKDATATAIYVPE